MSRTRSRLVLVAIIAIFFIPLVLAWLMWRGQLDWVPEGTDNHGELLDPPVRVAFDDRRLTGHWVLVYDAGATCDDACVDRVRELRAIRQTSGRDADRIRIALHHPHALGEVDREVLREASPGGLLYASERAGGSDEVWLIDPRGWHVLTYNAARNAADIADDLEHLLTWSKADS